MQKTTRSFKRIALLVYDYLHLAFGRFFAFSSSMSCLIAKRFAVFFEWDLTGFPTPVLLLAI